MAAPTTIAAIHEQVSLLPTFTVVSLLILLSRLRRRRRLPPRKMPTIARRACLAVDLGVAASAAVTLTLVPMAGRSLVRVLLRRSAICRNLARFRSRHQ